MLQILAVIIFVLGYIAITLEHRLQLNKAASALVLGGVLWLLVPFSDAAHYQEELMHTGSEIFDIVIFLLAAMSLVEILIHYGFFDFIRNKLYAFKLDDRKQFAVLMVITFFLSSIVDNLTTTIVMIQISRRFFKDTALLRAVAGVVIAANAGGAWSPLGDVTTIMLWLADKFTATEIITRGFLPALAMLGTMIALMYRKFPNRLNDTAPTTKLTFGKSEKIIISSVFISFLFPIVLSRFGLPPYLGLLLGLGYVWALVDIFKRISPKESHLSASIEEFLKKTDIPSLQFFVGILLAVAALSNLGILEYLSHFLYGSSASEVRLIGANISLGLLSAILDNVPLTAMAIDIMPSHTASIWVLLALTVGTGGSLLVVGSAAGVIAMGMVKELNFGNYIKLAFVPAIAAYFVGITVWYIQYLTLGAL